MGCISRPIAFVKRVVVPDIDRRRKVLHKTCHPNLVNLTDVFINQETVYFTYEKSGLSLRELQDMDDVTFDRIAVATICKEVLKGLIYMQEELGLHHGHLDSDCVYVNEDGQVKIGDVGNSMLAKEENQGTAHDIQSVYNLAADLLDLSTSSEKDTMSFHLAEDFTLLPSDVTFQEVMTHPFLAIAQDPWYLAYLGLMYTFGLQQHTWFKTPLEQGKGRKFSERS
ncbi:conserved hypothetical protein [Talaromyces stipitatus ATCC 10500]|uniref:Protein kinase domain-containing protein n=1 Tax=Talaromyces stipitatus (strain ATCC 10500 / CBS 375.48 / QM 6759 / NRRL 1006) TaxID=441959 RepID=B8M005_TALSN|nr:uncharacterized protein TSTA_081700 [Talaromyces stipitatus ATCC 10500]EED20937.1 conserved hypothetical protein [Talaromyces stipitatus ATCC 10500]